MRGVLVVCAGVCAVFWLGHTVCAYLDTHLKKSFELNAYCTWSRAFTETVPGTDQRANETLTKILRKPQIIYACTSKPCSDVDGVKGVLFLASPSGRARCASQCGTAWAEVPARCQGFVRHKRSTPAIARTQHTSCPGTQASHTLTPSSVHVSITYKPFVFIFSPFIPSYRCACWLIGDALCAICSNPTPHFHTHKHTLIPLITRVGLTICVPVCSHSDKREDVCVCGGRGGGVGGL